MYGSDTFKFIYVRVPRTASSTFCHYLDNVCSGHLLRLGGQHDSAVEMRRAWGEKWDEYHTFGFIRNPWEWLVSMYNANLSVGPNRVKEALPGGSGNGPMNRANMDFEEWIKARDTTCIDWLSEGGEVIVDEIRKFEDFVPNAAVSISGKDHPHYRDWYTPELADYVAKKCAKEIEIGRYAF